jgi:CDP-glucose 4,6-dehydratase
MGNFDRVFLLKYLQRVIPSAPPSSAPHAATLWSHRRVFLTGGTGLLGSHLAAALVQLGAECVVLIRDDLPHALLNTSKTVERVVGVRGSLQDGALLGRILNEYEISTVFHLAAQTLVGCAHRDPKATFESNVAGTWNLLDACRQNSSYLEAILVASSDKAYGNLHGSAYDETHPLQGRYPYDVSKSCADLIAQSYVHTYGLPIGITRCGNFFGGGDLNFSRLVPGTIRSILWGESPKIRSDGTYIRDYLYVEDGVQAYLTLAEALLRPKSPSVERLVGEAFNFSYGLRLSATQVVEKILQAMDSDLTPEILGTAKAEIPEQTLDSSKAKQRLGWAPHYGFDQGLQRTIAWYKNHLQHATAR